MNALRERGRGRTQDGPKTIQPRSIIHVYSLHKLDIDNCIISILFQDLILILKLQCSTLNPEDGFAYTFEHERSFRVQPIITIEPQTLGHLTVHLFQFAKKITTIFFTILFCTE